MGVDGQGTVLNLNGHTVECTSNTPDPVISVAGTANTVMGPGTGEYIMKSYFSILMNITF